MSASPLFFDLDGTISDPKRGFVACVRAALADLGLPAPKSSLDWMIGPPLHDSLDKLVGPDLAPKALALYRERYGRTGLFENDLYPGTAEMLERLRRQGAAMFVATSKLEVFARSIIEHFGLGGYFRAVYGSCADGARADKTALLAHIIAEEGLDGAGGIMIGDRAYDCIGAHANGLKSIGALWGYGTRSELEAAGCRMFADGPADIIGLVGAATVK